MNKFDKHITSTSHTYQIGGIKLTIAFLRIEEGRFVKIVECALNHKLI